MRNWRKLNPLKQTLVDDVKIPKTSISVICYSGYRVIKDKKSFTKFEELVKKFLADYDNNEEYKSFVQQGTSSNESVKSRLNYWRNIVRTMK